MVALFTTIGFAFIDHSEFVRVRRAPDLMPFGLQIPLQILCLVAMFECFYRRWFTPVTAVASTLFGIGTVVMVSTATPEQARLLLVTFFICFLLGLGVRQAMLSNVAILAAMFCATRVVELGPGVAAYLTFSLLCANIIGFGGAYALEWVNRATFLERRRLEQVAQRDGLTGLLNRQSFESRTRRLWQAAATHRRSLSVIMIDTDHFKAFNDLLGHQAGDHCLRQVALAVRATVGEGEDRFVARYGGEELVAVMLPTDESEPGSLAQAIVNAVADLSIEHPASGTLAKVTVSVGAATDGAMPDLSHDHVVKVADRALYTAKRQGRNRCVTVATHVVECGDTGAVSAR